MASVMYLSGINQLVAAFASMDIRCALVMSNTTADTENVGITYIGDFATLDECDATGYSRPSLSSEAVNIDTSNVRVELDGGDLTISGLSGDASRDYVGIVLIKHVTNDADSPAMSYIQFAVSRPSTATSISVPWNAEGILQIKQAA